MAAMKNFEKKILWQSKLQFLPKPSAKAELWWVVHAGDVPESDKEKKNKTDKVAASHTTMFNYEQKSGYLKNSN